MQISTYINYSVYLNRNMEFKVYGEKGIPFLVFPAQDGHCFDFENFNMIDSISSFIENGEIQVFCCSSVDQETYSNQNNDLGYRCAIIECWHQYIIQELVPQIHQINNSQQKIFVTGCSMGGAHSVNFMLRYPDIFAGCIALSGIYDTDYFFHDQCNEILYLNSPIKSLNGMQYDHPYVEKYRQQHIILCCGQGAWEEDMLYSTYKLKELFAYKDIDAWIDIWGPDVSHDWYWWQKQLPYFMNHLLNSLK